MIDSKKIYGLACVAFLIVVCLWASGEKVRQPNETAQQVFIEPAQSKTVNAELIVDHSVQSVAFFEPADGLVQLETHGAQAIPVNSTEFESLPTLQGQPIRAVSAANPDRLQPNSVARPFQRRPRTGLSSQQVRVAANQPARYSLGPEPNRKSAFIFDHASHLGSAGMSSGPEVMAGPVILPDSNFVGTEFVPGVAVDSK